MTIIEEGSEGNLEEERVRDSKSVLSPLLCFLNSRHSMIGHYW